MVVVVFSLAHLGWKVVEGSAKGGSPSTQGVDGPPEVSYLYHSLEVN